MKLPEWSREFYPEQMKEFHEKFFIYQAFNYELKKLKGGPLLKKIIQDWNEKVRGEIKKKFLIFSGHDVTGL